MNPINLHSNQIVLVGIPAQGYTVADLKNAFEEEINQPRAKKLINPNELERVKAQVIAGNIYNRDSLINQVMDLGVPEAIGLSWRVSQEELKRIESSVTTEQIQQVAQLYLTPQRLTIAVLEPTGRPFKETIIQSLHSGLH